MIYFREPSQAFNNALGRGQFSETSASQWEYMCSYENQYGVMVDEFRHLKSKRLKEVRNDEFLSELKSSPTNVLKFRAVE